MSIALVLLDIQKGILASDAIKFESPEIPKMAIGAARAMLDAARSSRTPVIHVGVARPHQRGVFDEVRTAAGLKTGKAPRDVLALAPGSADIEFLLPPLQGEETIYKVGVSAFEGTRLDQVLRSAQVRDVVVAGAFTHMVVESTVRQGFDLGYRMIVAQDACCAPAAAPHNNALATCIPNFAVVTDSGAIIERLKQGATVAA